jgi:hypothetical protein
MKISYYLIRYGDDETGGRDPVEWRITITPPEGDKIEQSFNSKYNGLEEGTTKIPKRHQKERFKLKEDIVATSIKIEFRKIRNYLDWGYNSMSMESRMNKEMEIN